MARVVPTIPASSDQWGPRVQPGVQAASPPAAKPGPRVPNSDPANMTPAAGKGPTTPTDFPDPRGPFATERTPVPGVGPLLPNAKPNSPAAPDPSARPNVSREGFPIG
jgi:hypothetical protein